MAGPWEEYAQSRKPGPWDDYAVPRGTISSTPNQEAGSPIGALWDGLLHGAGNIAMGAGRLLAAGSGIEGAADAAGRRLETRQRAFEQQPSVKAHPTATAVGEVGGEMLAAAPAGVGRAMAGVWERLLQGGLSGGLGGAVGAAATAPGGEKFGPAVSQGASIGAGAGAAMGAAGAAARPSVLTAPRQSPASMVRAPEAKTWTEAARMMTGQGVRLSPGQALGMGYRERSLQEWPILRNFVRGAVGRSVDDFDRATMAQSLSPLGTIVPRSVRGGHDLIDFGVKEFNAAYDQVLPHLRLSREGVNRLVQADPELTAMMSEMAEDDARRLTNIIQNKLLGRFDDAGVMDGRLIKQVEHDFADRAASLRGGRDDELGRALQTVLSKIRGVLAEENPEFAPQLQRINQAYSMFVDLRAAANRNATSKGRYTPSDLLQSIKRESSETAFARGASPMQAFAEAGQEVIGESLSSRFPEQSKSFARMIGDVAGGAVTTPLYVGAGLAQRTPGLGRGIAAGAGGAGYEAGQRRGRDRFGNFAPATTRLPGETDRRTIVRPKDDEWIEPLGR